MRFNRLSEVISDGGFKGDARALRANVGQNTVGAQGRGRSTLSTGHSPDDSAPPARIYEEIVNTFE